MYFYGIVPVQTDLLKGHPFIVHLNPGNPEGQPDKVHLQGLIGRRIGPVLELLNDEFFFLPGQPEIPQAVFPFLVVVAIMGVLVKGRLFRTLQIIDIQDELFNFLLAHVLLNGVLGYYGS